MFTDFSFNVNYIWRERNSRSNQNNRLILQNQEEHTIFELAGGILEQS